MSEYGSDWDDNDDEYRQDHDVKDVDLEKEPELSKDLNQDYDPFECPNYDKGDLEYDPFKCPEYDKSDLEYDPFTPTDLTLSDDSKEYDPFTLPDLTLSDDSKDYDPFTPPDLTLKGECSNKEIEAEIIKENDPEIIEERSIDHNITFDHIYEKDLEDIVKDIDQAEELHAIYAEDIMIPSGDKEAVEQHYMEQMKDEGVIIANDLYFEETPEKKQATLDHFNELTTDSINNEKEQLNKELDPSTKTDFTEIDAKDISLASDIEYDNEAHESMAITKELNEQNEEIQAQKGKNLDVTKFEAKNMDKEQEIQQKYSSSQRATQVLKQELEEIPNQGSQECKEEKLSDIEEIQQNEVKKDLIPEANNKVEKEKISQEIEKDHINFSRKKKESEITAKKSEFDHKNIEQEAEIKEHKQEKIESDKGFKEEWEKELIEWIKGVKDEDLSLEKKVELIEFMRKYRNAREDHTRLHYLTLQHKNEEISGEEKQEHTYLREKIKEYDELDEEMFKEFHAFRCFYDYNKKRWYNTITNSKKKRYPKLVAQKLERLKENKIKKIRDFQYKKSQVLNGNKRLSQNFKEILRENLYKFTMSLEEKSKINKIIQKKSLNDDDEKKLTSILIKLPTDEFKLLLGKKVESILKISEFKKEKKTKRSIRIIHYNKWLTNNIKDYIENLDNRIKFLFEPYKSFIKMSSLFGLSKTYLKDQRKSVHAKKIIAESLLDKMRISLKLNIEKWIKSYPYLSDLLLKAQRDIIAFIDDYENELSPKPTSHYRMYINHPNFIRDFFEVIDTKEKAYWLGFLFADGYITIEHTNSGDYYRMGLELSEKDRNLVERFCNTIGLNPKHIKTRVRLHSYTKKKYRLCSIRWGDQDFANNLLKNGMEYEYNNKKGKRVKIMKLPDLCNNELMVAFILGFYDGDGNLGLVKGKKRDSIYPVIKSSNKEFLIEIKEYFDIKSDIKSKIEDKYDFKRKLIVKSKIYSLYLGIDLFREMLQSYKNSLIRKRIPLDRIEKYGISPVKHWLMSVLQKEKLRKMLKVISPYKIGKMLGVRVETIYSLAKDVYGLEIPNNREQYIRIQQLIKNRDETSQYFKDFYYWLKYLEKQGKFEG